MTNEEKLQKLSEACTMIAESLKTIEKAKKMLKSCGIVLCDSFKTTVHEWAANEEHALIYSGIGKFEKITGQKATYGVDIIDKNKPDKSQKFIEYNGVRFCQVADNHVTNKYSWR